MPSIQPAADDAATPETAAPETDAPDLLVDLGFDPPPDATELALQPTLSHIGRYALKRRLASGGLGAVYEAWDPLLSRTVAVKTLQFDVDAPARLSLDGLFLNEARTAAGLNHRYIVTVHDAGLSSQGVYIAMERLYGRDLRDALAQGWRPTPERAALLVRRVADALAYAHARDVVHCDIKPANIFLTRRWRPKVLDFGISRAAGVAAPALDGLLAGSPHYLAPEQLQGGDVDARTDVYALGAVLYELLAGRKAFDGDSLEAITDAVLGSPPPAPHLLRPMVPSTLSEIAMKALARSAQHRFGSAAEMAQALRDWTLDAAREREPRRTPPRRRRGWPLAAAVLAPMALAAWVGLAPDKMPAPAATDRAGAMVAPGATAAALQPIGDHAAPGADATAAGTAQRSVAADRAAAPAPATPAPPVGDNTPTHAAPTSPRQSPATPAAAPQPSAQRAETTRQRSARQPAEGRSSAAAAPAAAAESATGTLQIAVSPWGQIEVDGQPAGTTPPLTQLTLSQGQHTVTVRNADFAPFTTTVQVHPDRPVVIRHRFGS